MGERTTARSGGRTRRDLLRATGVALGAGVAGCSLSPGVAGELPERAAASFRRGLRRRGYAPEESIPDSGRPAWRLPGVNTGDHTASKSSPVLAPDGTVVVCGDSGSVYSVRPDGHVNWAAEVGPTERGIHGTPAIAGETVFVGAYDGVLYAFDLATGERVWRTRLGDAIGGSPAYHDGTLYVAVEFAAPSGSLYAVDAATGDVEAEDGRPTNHPHSTPGIDLETGTLSIGSNDGFLYTWSFPDLEFVRRFDAGADVKAPIAVHDGAALFGSWDDAIFRVDLAAGRQDWRFDVDGNAMSGVGIDPDRGVAYVGSHDGNVYALDVATGEALWEFDTGGWVTGCPTVTGDRLAVGSYTGELFALDAATGEALWAVGDGGHVTCEPLVHDGAVYYTARATDERTGGLVKVVGA